MPMLRRFRLPMGLAAGGAVFKILQIVAWRVSKSATAFQFLTAYDPISFGLAEVGVSVVFSQERIAPSNLESMTFEVLLVAGFSLQCFLLGLILQSLVGLLNKRWSGTS